MGKEKIGNLKMTTMRFAILFDCQKLVGQLPTMAIPVKLWSFQGMDTKLDRFWLKTNYYQIKSLNFVNWFIGVVFDNINF